MYSPGAVSQFIGATPAPAASTPVPLNGTAGFPQSIALPNVGGFSGTMVLTPATTAAGVLANASLGLTPPSGAPGPTDGDQPLVFVGLSVSANLVLSGVPAFSFTVPASAVQSIARTPQSASSLLLAALRRCQSTTRLSTRWKLFAQRPDRDVPGVVTKPSSYSRSSSTCSSSRSGALSSSTPAPSPSASASAGGTTVIVIPTPAPVACSPVQVSVAVGHTASRLPGTWGSSTSAPSPGPSPIRPSLRFNKPLRRHSASPALPPARRPFPYGHNPAGWGRSRSRLPRDAPSTKSNERICQELPNDQSRAQGHRRARGLLRRRVRKPRHSVHCLPQRRRIAPDVQSQPDRFVIAPAHYGSAASLARRPAYISPNTTHAILSIDEGAPGLCGRVWGRARFPGRLTSGSHLFAVEIDDGTNVPAQGQLVYNLVAGSNGTLSPSLLPLSNGVAAQAVFTTGTLYSQTNIAGTYAIADADGNVIVSPGAFDDYTLSFSPTSAAGARSSRARKSTHLIRTEPTTTSRVA